MMNDHEEVTIEKMELQNAESRRRIQEERADQDAQGNHDLAKLAAMERARAVSAEQLSEERGEWMQADVAPDVFMRGSEQMHKCASLFCPRDRKDGDYFCEACRNASNAKSAINLPQEEAHSFTGYSDLTVQPDEDRLDRRWMRRAAMLFLAAVCVGLIWVVYHGIPFWGRAGR